MNNALDGKVALVTGCGRGIGAAVALRLAQGGADVALTFQHNQQRTDDVAEQIKRAGRRAIAIPADSADPAAVTAAVDRVAGDLGRLDILVNNAGAFCSVRWSSWDWRSSNRPSRSTSGRRSSLRRQRSATCRPVGGSSTSAATWPSGQFSPALRCTR